VFFIGVKYFWSSMQRGRLKNVLRLTILSLSINIGVFIAGLALIRGFQGETLSKTLHIYGHAQLPFYKPGQSDLLDITIEEKQSHFFKTFPIVRTWLNSVGIKVDHGPIKLEKVIQKYEFQGGVSRQNKTDGILINGLSESDAKYLLHKYMQAGQVNFTSPDRREGAIIGHRLASKLGVGVGGTFNLLLKAGNDLDSVPMLVMGIFDLGFYEFDSSLIFVRSGLLSEYKATPTTIVYTNRPQEIDQYIKVVLDTDPSINIYSWRKRNRLIEDMFNSQIRAISIIMGLFILSAIIQSISSLYVLLSERSYDLSVLTMLGMSNYQRYAMFAAYGLLVSLSNTLFGIISGIGLVLIYPHFKNIFENLTGHSLIHSEAFWISDFNPELLLSDILIVGMSTLIIMSLSMLLAAHFTSKIDVIRGLKE
jgi:lipoprotein-releasing system permease protein